MDSTSKERSLSTKKEYWNERYADHVIRRTILITINQIENDNDSIENIDAIVAVANGGIPLGKQMASWFNLPLIIVNPNNIDTNILPHYFIITEDVVDSGETLNLIYKQFRESGFEFECYIASIVKKPWNPHKEVISGIISNKWIVLPWEEK